jgi:phosphoglucomutase
MGLSVSGKDVDQAVKKMILSASGWRGVFAEDGNEESKSPAVSPVYQVIAAAAAEVFAAYLKSPENGGPSQTKDQRPLVIVGTDTRPTGKAIAEAAMISFTAQGCDIRYSGVNAAPEIMAYARSKGAAAGTKKTIGFMYISASHNPIGHNGIKFGLTGGGVLAACEAARLIEKFRDLALSPEAVERIRALLDGAGPETLKTVYAGMAAAKEEAYAAYLGFVKEVAYGSGGTSLTTGAGIAGALAEGIGEKPVGIAADFNGSARAASIDKEFLSGLGVSIKTMNDVPGAIAHRIVPEGDSLDPCRYFLEELHAGDSSFIMGYVPDCDGDRGNLVIWDESEKKARILEAQEVFALACVAELTHLVWTGELSYDNKGNAMQKAAVAVNDPTSLRIDRIARSFDVSVFRSEVGEANVVGLAQKLREKGYIVRILGEGSAGGNITYPSAVRDPINTVLALLKLIAVRSRGNRPGFFEIWCDLSGQAETYRPDFTLADIIASLPSFVTTGSYSQEAVLKVKTEDHSLLKNRYQELFLRDWEARKDSWKTKYGITGWEASAYIGMEEKRGITRFGDAGRGGLKVSFLRAGNPVAAIWMRGSATEPVFRIMADIEGSDKRIERGLIEWQRSLVAEADKSVSGGGSLSS